MSLQKSKDRVQSLLFLLISVFLLLGLGGLASQKHISNLFINDIDLVVLFVRVACITLAITVAWLANLYLCYSRVIEETPTGKIGACAGGYVELEGVVGKLPNSEVVGKLSGRPYAWYRYELEKYVYRSKNGGWETLDKGSSTQPILFKDDTGTCIINPTEAQVDTPYKLIWKSESSKSTTIPLRNDQKSTVEYMEKYGEGSPYEYALCLLTQGEELQPWKIYVETDRAGAEARLKYTVLDYKYDNAPVTGYVGVHEIPQLKSLLMGTLTVDALLPLLPKLLKITASRGHTQKSGGEFRCTEHFLPYNTPLYAIGMCGLQDGQKILSNENLPDDRPFILSAFSQKRTCGKYKERYKTCLAASLLLLLCAHFSPNIANYFLGEKSEKPHTVHR